MQIAMAHALAGKGTVDLIGNPIKFSGTPVEYRMAPPHLGQHTDEVLKQLLDLPEAEIARLRAAGVI
jgi:crotonobetainyl-CoA:carnitine CoA-transferase CaiB-like acyl-CoA transferase